jgi:Raf kinase inhibitor-like YbhB/YbcL family protein
MNARSLGFVLLFGCSIVSVAAQQRGDNPSPIPRNLLPIPRLRLISPAFADGGKLPLMFTCYNNPQARRDPDGTAQSPPFSWQGANFAEGQTASFVLKMDGPDVHPNKGIAIDMFWTLWNIPPGTTHLSQGVKIGPELPDGSRQATGQGGIVGYRGPCATSGVGRLNYVFTLYALDQMLNLPGGATEADVDKAMDGHILSTSIYVGTLER